MPKMKTHSGAKKRFKLTATGKVRGRHAFTSHILEKKSAQAQARPRRPRVTLAPTTPRGSSGCWARRRKESRKRGAPGRERSQEAGS